MKKITTRLTVLALLLLAGGSQCAWAEDEDYEVLTTANSKLLYGTYTSYDSLNYILKFDTINGGYGNDYLLLSYTQAIDISNYNYLVVELDSASTQSFEVNLATATSINDWWELTKIGSCAAGATKYAICLDTCSNFTSKSVGIVSILTGWNYGNTVDTYDFKSIRFTNFVEPIAEQEFGGAYITWNADKLTWDADEGTIKISAGDGNATLAWLDNYTDISEYDSLVVELAEGSESSCEIGVSEVGWGDAANVATLKAGATKLVVDLDAEYTYTSKSTTYTDTLNLDSINMIFIRSSYSPSSDYTIALSEVYLETSDGTKKYLWHKSGAYARKSGSGAYGTICLPYAAVADSAKVYEVVGYGTTTDDNGNETPSELYLDAVDSLEAGVAYVFQSSANDSIVTFTLSGDSVGAATGNALVGTYSKADVDSKYYILTTSTADDGTVSYVWGKGKSNSVGKYKAYLDLSVFEKSTGGEEAKANGWISMSLAYDGDDGTTGIKEIVSEEENVEDDDVIYNLSGVRVTNPQKGIYIKNGKKYIIK